MYVMKTSRAHGSTELLEMTRKELAKRKAEESPFHFREVSASYAHRYVKDGGLHGTPLWVDCDGRIRRARG